MTTPAYAPTWQVLVGFNNNAMDDPGLITTIAAVGTTGARNVWTDITLYVQSMNTMRGKQHELDKFQAGTATINLWNGDGRFDPWNAAGPYAGLLLPGKPVRIQATYAATTYPVFTGITDVWPTAWPDSVRSTVALACLDAFSLFNLADLNTNQYPIIVAADGAGCLYRYAEPVGASGAQDTLSLNGSGTFTGAVTLGVQGPFVTDTATGIEFTDTGTNGGAGCSLPASIPSYSGSATQFSFECWVAINSIATSSSFPLFTQFYKTSSGLAAPVGMTVSYSGYVACNLNGSSFYTSLTAPVIPFDGVWRHVVVTINYTTGVGAIYVNGVSFPVTYNETPHIPAPLSYSSGAAAPAQSSTLVCTGSMANIATYSTALTAAQVLAHYKAGIVLETQESSDARIGEALTVIGWPTGARQLDAGNSQIQGNGEDLTQTTALSHMQDVELSENGSLFMNKAGQVRFINRRNILLPPYNTSQVTFGDGGGAEIPFEPTPQLALDTLDLWNIAQITRNGGNTQTAKNQASITAYGPRTLQPSDLLLLTDAECLNYAQWEVAHFDQPVPRIRAIDVYPRDTAGLAGTTVGAATTAVLTRELLDRATVNRHTLPGGGTGFSQVGLIEQIAHTVDFTSGDWKTTFAFTPADTQAYWILGDATYGVLGTTTRLAY